MLLSFWDEKWYLLMYTIGITYIVISVSMFFLLVPDPKEVGIEMQKEEDAWYNVGQD